MLHFGGSGWGLFLGSVILLLHAKMRTCLQNSADLTVHNKSCYYKCTFGNRVGKLNFIINICYKMKVSGHAVSYLVATSCHSFRLLLSLPWPVSSSVQCWQRYNFSALSPRLFHPSQYRGLEPLCRQTINNTLIKPLSPRRMLQFFLKQNIR